MESALKEPGVKSRVMLLACIAALAPVRPAMLVAQGRPEVRADVITSQETAFYAGLGVLFPTGTYLRSGAVGGAGVVAGDATFRLDVVSLFHADPFRESRWGPYGGGGISFRQDTKHNESNSFLMVFLGLEGPPGREFSPAFELGLGGGLRAGIILRRASGRTR